MPFQNPLAKVKYVDEVWRVAAEYEVWFDGKKIKVKIFESPDGKFMGITDHEIKTSSQATPYQSIHTQSTEEDALRDAIEGLRVFYKPEEAEACWIKVEDF